MSAEPSSRRRAQEFWDAQSRWNAFVAICGSDDMRDPEHAGPAFWRAGEADARRLLPFFAPGERVLDLGCGMGRVLFFLAPRAGEVVGVDISLEMLARAEQAFAGVPNARFLRTSGASLAGIESGSVDFVYSLLCMIHVDRRSAYRYLEEIQRVLRPGGIAFLQFQNIASEAGLAKFRAVLDADYPLEFYTLEELRFLVASVGLDPVTAFSDREYIYLTVIAGDAAAWRAAIAGGVKTDSLETDSSGNLTVVLNSSFPALRPLRLELAVARAGAPISVFDAVLDLPPGRSQLELRRADPLSEPSARLDNRRLDLRPIFEARDESKGALEFHAALVPPGYVHTEEFRAAFPGLVCSWR